MKKSSFVKSVVIGLMLLTGTAVASAQEKEASSLAWLTVLVSASVSVLRV